MNREILRLAIPNIISNITIPLLGIVDLAIMGHLDSPVYIGAIALGSIIFNFLYLGFGFLRMGTSGFTAQAYGENNKSEIIVLLSRGLTVSLLSGLVFIVLQSPIEWFSFWLMDGTEGVKELAKSYFRIRIYAAPAALSNLVLIGWFLGMQNARIPMIIALTVNFLNIGLNFLFVYQFNMQSDGVALATVIAQYTGLLISLGFFLKKYKYTIREWSYKSYKNLKAFKHFISINLDIFIRTICIIFSFGFFTSVSAKMGNDILAVNQLYLQLLYLFSYFIDGFAHAAEALVGKYFGARKPFRLRIIIRKVMVWGVGLGSAFSFLYLFADQFILRLMTDQTELLEKAKEVRFWNVLIPLTSFAAFIYDGVFIGLTASKPMRNTLLISLMLVFLPVYYLGQPFLGIHGLWLAMNLFMLARGILLRINLEKAIRL